MRDRHSASPSGGACWPSWPCRGFRLLRGSGRARRGAERGALTIDTLRADRLGCYGYARPSRDARRLASRGVRFETAVASPAHGTLPRVDPHRAHSPGPRSARQRGLCPAEGVRTVAEDFRRAGYRTAGFVSGFPLKRRFGFDGASTRTTTSCRAEGRAAHAYVERTADRTTDAPRCDGSRPSRRRVPPEAVLPVGALLRPHAPYEAPAQAMASVASPYDGEVAFVDAQLAASPPRRGEEERADPRPCHGRPRREPGRARRGHPRHLRVRLHLRVPFILAGPGFPGAVSPTGRARHRRRPHLLDYAGLAGREWKDGRSGGRPPAKPCRRAGLRGVSPFAAAVRLGPVHAWRPRSTS